jgi:N-acetylglucosamine malate deacetylase 1
MNEFYKRKFFILTAHPDDAESACAGLISKIIKNSGTVTNCIMVRPSAEINANRNETIVKFELENSQKILRHIVKFYNTPLHDNGRPNLLLTNNLVTTVENLSKDFDVLITHWKEDYHQEHRICYELAQSLSRKSFKEFWCMDQVPYNLHYREFKTNLYVDITEFVDIKRKALECYNSYFSKEKIDQILNYNRYRGSFIGENKIAETYSIQYQKIA